MQITVELHASFRIGRFKSQVLSVSASATIRQVVHDVGVPERDVGIVLINGRHAGLGDTPKEGDVVSLMPRIGGG